MLLVSFVSLGFRTGIIVALSVPLVLAVVFVFMMRWGSISQRISLGALIIALGLLVDDAIIAVEMMTVKMEQGYDRVTAATFAWSSTAFPMLTGTLVTAAGFMPVGFANSSTGEYTGSLFWVLGVALVASWFVAVIFTPYLGVKLLAGDCASDQRIAIRTRSTRRRSIARCAASITWTRRQSPSSSSPCTAGVLVLAGLGLFMCRSSSSRISERPELFFQLRLPEGSSIFATSSAAAGGRGAAEGRSRRGRLHDLHRPGAAALLARPQSGAAQ